MVRRVATTARWSVYLVRRADGALYTGIALDVAARVRSHEAGRGAKALRGRGPLRLVFRRRIGARGSALRAEAGIKKLSKAEKELLVSSAAAARRWFRAQAAALSSPRSRAIPR